MTFPSFLLFIRAAFQCCWRKTLVRVFNSLKCTYTLHVMTAGKDASRAFYSLHRSEVLHRPQYARLKIGTINSKGSPKASSSQNSGSLSQVPYAEPTWLTEGYHSPYYTDVCSRIMPEIFLLNFPYKSHHRFQAAVRMFVEEVIFPDAQAREEDGKMPSRHVFDEMARLNIIAMRLGPGQHLKDRVLMNGIVKPEEVSPTLCSVSFLVLKASSLTIFMN